MGSSELLSAGSQIQAKSSSDSFARFYRQHRENLGRAAWALVGDLTAAEDIVAETAELMWSRWNQIGGPGDEATGFRRMRSFARSTVHHKALEYYRRSRRDYPLAQVDLEYELSAMPAGAGFHVGLEEALHILRELPGRQRLALAMRVLGYDDGEVAEQLGVGEGTVRCHIALARQKITKYLRSDADTQHGLSQAQLR